MNNIIYKNKIQIKNDKNIIKDIQNNDKNNHENDENTIINFFYNIYIKIKKFNNFLKREENKKIIYLIVILSSIIFLISIYENDIDKNFKMIGGAEMPPMDQSNMGNLDKKQLKAENEQLKNKKSELKKDIKKQKENFKKNMKDERFGNRDKQGNLLRDKKGNVIRRGFYKEQFYRVSRILYLLMLAIIIFIIPFLPMIIYIVLFYKVIINLTQYIFSK
jgi:hypothetical protein